jgi:hypothetical protein
VGPGCPSIEASSQTVGLAWAGYSPYYFSTVTFTPGFGDISAKTWVGEFVAMREVISGYTTLGLLRSVRADKKERQNSCQPFARFECALSHACLGFAFV